MTTTSALPVLLSAPLRGAIESGGLTTANWQSNLPFSFDHRVIDTIVDVERALKPEDRERIDALSCVDAVNELGSQYPYWLDMHLATLEFGYGSNAVLTALLITAHAIVFDL